MQNKLTDLQTLINSLPPDKQAIFISLTQQLHAGLISQQQFQEQAMALGFAPKRPGSPLDPANKRTRTDSPLPLQQPRWTTQAFSASPAQMPVLPSGYATPTAKRAIVDVNKLDVDSMMDVTSYGGVDLKEEELTMTDMLPRQRRALSHFKDTVFLNMKVLEKTVAHIAGQHGVHDIDDSFNAMVSAALCDFMTGFLQDLCRAADHRTGTDLDVFLDEQPSEGPQIDLVPLDDIKTQLYRIEQRERIEYDRIFNLIGPPPMPEDEMAELASQGGSGASTPVGTPPVQTPAAKGADKKKPKKSSKKDLPESVKNKLTNSAAMMAAGGTMKSWMVPGGVTSMASAPPKKLATRVNPKSSGQFAPAAIRANRAVKTNKRIALKDALFVLEGNPMLNNSDTLYKWWANIK